MKTRTLFLTLLISISILLISNGLAFADPITGCVKKSTGVIYNVQIGDTPAYPCHFLDEQITWSEQGPQGEPGDPGENGQDGTIIHQVQLEDSNDPTCETVFFPIPAPPFPGWCPNGTSPQGPDQKTHFIIPDPMITPESVVIATIGDLSTIPSATSFFPRCVVRFINPNFSSTSGAFNFHCDFPVIDGVPLNYVIINPPPTP